MSGLWLICGQFLLYILHKTHFSVWLEPRYSESRKCHTTFHTTYLVFTQFVANCTGELRLQVERCAGIELHCNLSRIKSQILISSQESIELRLGRLYGTLMRVHKGSD